ncbi:hypothetical protein OAN47_04095 [Planctomycetota bacterium]|nr:hypothetical protein [Planctomycetota bacterium]
MNEDSKSRSGPPEPVLAMISGWLTLRGLAWLATSTGLLDLNFLQSTPLLDGLIGMMCLALARQVWIGTPGSTPPVFVLLLMHATLQIYNWGFLHPELWSSLAVLQRGQIILETGTASLFLAAILFLRPLRTQNAI